MKDPTSSTLFLATASLSSSNNMDTNLLKDRQSLRAGQADLVRHVGAALGSAKHDRVAESILDDDLYDARVQQPAAQGTSGLGPRSGWKDSDRQLYQKKTRPWDGVAGYRPVRNAETAFRKANHNPRGSYTSSKRVETTSSDQHQKTNSTQKTQNHSQSHCHSKAQSPPFASSRPRKGPATPLTDSLLRYRSESSQVELRPRSI